MKNEIKILLTVLITLSLPHLAGAQNTTNDTTSINIVKKDGMKLLVMPLDTPKDSANLEESVKEDTAHFHVNRVTPMLKNLPDRKKEIKRKD